MCNSHAWDTEKPEISFLKRACFHESGHGVTQYLLGCELTGIKVNPVNKSGKCSRDCRPYIGLEIPSLRIAEIEREVLIFCGGAAAEWILTGVQDWDHQSSDYRHAVDILTPICEDEEEISAYIELMLVRARNFLNTPQHWRATVDLANSLIWLNDNDESWCENDAEGLALDDCCESGRGLREMSGSEVEAVIRYALDKDKNTYDN